MNKKYKCSHIYDELFMKNFYVYYGIKPAIFIDEVKRIIGNVNQEDLNLKLLDGKMIVYSKQGMPIIFIWTRYKNIPILVHECMHATHYVLNSKGFELCDEIDELYAYYVQYLVRKILNKKEC